MSPLIITIGLILITLASTIVSIFWMSVLRGRLMLLVLAVCSSAGAIYTAYEMERRANSISNKLDAILQGNSVQNGFEDTLLQAANQIAAQENYSKATLQKTALEWNSEYFGYGVAFSEPSIERPLTGHEELSMRTGYAHTFAYVSKLSAGKLILTFLEGGDLKRALGECILWVWENRDMTDERFLQSLQGIAYLAYSAATGSSSQHSHEFQRQPEDFWIDLDIDDERGVTLLLRARDPSNTIHLERIHLDNIPLSGLDELVGVDALTRGGKIFYRLYEKMLFEWADPDYLPVVLGR